MHDALLVGGGECAGDRDPVTKNTVHWQATRRQDCGERVALEVLHHDVINAIFGSDVMQRTDVGMVQIRDGAGFAFETPSGFEIDRNFREQDLDRHRSAESNILCPVHLAHAACAEKSFQAIGAEFGAGLEPPGTRHSLTNGVLAMLTDGSTLM